MHTLRQYWFHPLKVPLADLPGRPNYEKYGIQTPGCAFAGCYNDVWVFNPKGWSRDQILGAAAAKYEKIPDSQILPTRPGFDQVSPGPALRKEIVQDFSDFRLSETGNFSTENAWNEGWECSAWVQILKHFYNFLSIRTTYEFQTLKIIKIIKKNFEAKNKAFKENGVGKLICPDH